MTITKEKRILKGGKYGILRVGSGTDDGRRVVHIRMDFYNAEQLREAAHILNQVAEHLESERA